MIIELDEMVAVIDGRIIPLGDIELRGVPCGWVGLRLLGLNIGRITSMMSLPDRAPTTRRPGKVRERSAKRKPKPKTNLLGDSERDLAKLIIRQHYAKMPLPSYDSGEDAAVTGAWEVCAACSKYADRPERERLNIVARSAANWARMQRRGKPQPETVPLTDVE